VRLVESIARLFVVLLALVLCSACDARPISREESLEEWVATLRKVEELRYSRCEYTIIREHNIPQCRIEFKGLVFYFRNTPIGFGFLTDGPDIADKVAFYEFSSGDIATSHECRPAQMFSNIGFDCTSGDWEDEGVISKKRTFPDRYFVGGNHCRDCFIKDEDKLRLEFSFGARLLKHGLIARVNGKNFPVEPVVELARQFAARFPSEPVK
jgi:hypothetical protein